MARSLARSVTAARSCVRIQRRVLATKTAASAQDTPSAQAAAQKRVCLITGANTGLGKQAALELSRKGYQVVGACRSMARGEAAARELQASGGDMSIMELDLASLASTRAFAEKFLQQFGQLDVLINNAGPHVCPKFP